MNDGAVVELPTLNRIQSRVICLRDELRERGKCPAHTHLGVCSDSRYILRNLKRIAIICVVVERLGITVHERFYFSHNVSSFVCFLGRLSGEERARVLVKTVVYIF